MSLRRGERKNKSFFRAIYLAAHTQTAGHPSVRQMQNKSRLPLVLAHGMGAKERTRSPCRINIGKFLQALACIFVAECMSTSM